MTFEGVLRFLGGSDLVAPDLANNDISNLC
jgi:hypothetical protein